MTSMETFTTVLTLMAVILVNHGSPIKPYTGDVPNFSNNPTTPQTQPVNGSTLMLHGNDGTTSKTPETSAVLFTDGSSLDDVSSGDTPDESASGYYTEAARFTDDVYFSGSGGDAGGSSGETHLTTEDLASKKTGVSNSTLASSQSSSREVDGSRSRDFTFATSPVSPSADSTSPNPTQTTTSDCLMTEYNEAANFDVIEMLTSLDAMKRELNTSINHYCADSAVISQEMQARNISCEDMSERVASGDIDTVFRLPEPSEEISNQTVDNLAAVVRAQITRMLLYARAVQEAGNQERLVSCDYKYGEEKCLLDVVHSMCNLPGVEEKNFICKAKKITGKANPKLKVNHVIGLWEDDLTDITVLFDTNTTYIYLLKHLGDLRCLREEEVSARLTRCLRSVPEVRLLTLGALHRLAAQTDIAIKSMEFLQQNNQTFPQLFKES